MAEPGTPVPGPAEAPTTAVFTVDLSQDFAEGAFPAVVGAGGFPEEPAAPGVPSLEELQALLEIPDADLERLEEAIATAEGAVPEGAHPVTVLVRAVLDLFALETSDREAFRQELRGARLMIEKAELEAKGQVQALKHELQLQLHRAEQCEVQVARLQTEKREAESASALAIAAAAERAEAAEEVAANVKDKFGAAKDAFDFRLEELEVTKEDLEERLAAERGEAERLRQMLEEYRKDTEQTLRTLTKEKADVDAERRFLQGKLLGLEESAQALRKDLAAEKGMLKAYKKAHKKLTTSFQQIAEARKAKDEATFEGELLDKRFRAADQRLSAFKGVLTEQNGPGGRPDAAEALDAVEAAAKEIVLEEQTGVNDAKWVNRKVASRVIEAEDAEVRAALASAPGFLRRLGLGYRFAVAFCGEGKATECFAAFYAELGSRYRCHSCMHGEIRSAHGLIQNPNARAMMKIAHTYLWVLTAGNDGPQAVNAVECLRHALAAAAEVILLVGEEVEAAFNFRAFCSRNCEGELGGAEAEELAELWHRREVIAMLEGPEVVDRLGKRAGFDDAMMEHAPDGLLTVAKSWTRRPDLCFFGHVGTSRVAFDLGATDGLELLKAVVKGNDVVTHLVFANVGDAAAHEVGDLLAGASTALRVVETGIRIPVGKLLRNQVASLAWKAGSIKDSDALLLSRVLLANSSLKELDVRGARLSEKALEELLAAVDAHRGIEQFCGISSRAVEESLATDGGTLALSGARCGLAGVLFLAGLIRKRPSLRCATVNLSANDLGPAGIRHLNRACRGLVGCSIAALIVSGNGIGPLGAGDLAEMIDRAQPATIDVSGNGLGNAGLKALAGAVRGAKAVSLGNNDVGAEGAQALCEALRGAAELESLSLVGNHIGDRGLGALAGVLRAGEAPLRTLDLGDNHSFGDTAMKALGAALERNATLEYLSLSKTQLTSRGVANLCQFLGKEAKLKVLKLEKCKLRSDAMASCAEMLLRGFKLKELHLKRNSVGDRGVFGLAPGLNKCALQVLDVTHNGIRSEGARALTGAARVRAGKLTVVAAENNFKDAFFAGLVDTALSSPPRKLKIPTAKPPP